VDGGIMLLALVREATAALNEAGRYAYWLSNSDAIYFDQTSTWSGLVIVHGSERKMKKFMAIYMASGADFEKMMRNSTPDQRQKGMEGWMKWMNENRASILEGGAPLGKTKRADATGVSDTKNNIGGYSIVQAETHDAAAKLFSRDHPHLQMPGAWVEILEIMTLPA
jgi:hypothetical protein